MDILSQTDLVISPHGAQLTGIPFLPTCAAVLELFPEGYLIPNYFGSLAAASEVAHSYLYLGKDATATPQDVQRQMNQDKKLRSASRKSNLCPATQPFLQAVDSHLPEGHFVKACWLRT